MSEWKYILKRFALLFAAVFSALYCPVELPKSQEKLPKGNYIIVKNVHTTSAEWFVHGDQNGFYKEDTKEGKHVNLSGNTPYKKYCNNIASYWSDTYFICYAEYVGRSSLGYHNELLDTYEVSECYLMGPIIRNNIDYFFNIRTKSYVCFWDKWEKHSENKRGRTNEIKLFFGD